MTNSYLPGHQSRTQWMRLDAATLLNRYFYCERALIKGQAGWLPSIAPLDIKLTLSRFLWEDTMVADALRERVLELRFPSRLMEKGEDALVINLFEEAVHAPSPEAFILSLAKILKPALSDFYQSYLKHSDTISDGPTHRFMKTAIREKSAQIKVLKKFAEIMLSDRTQARIEAKAWVKGLNNRLEDLGRLSLEESQSDKEAITDLSGRKSYSVPDIPARDKRFHICRFYWPDIIDPKYPYGEGIQLQLRSAISHLNEVWAVEAAGISLYVFADDLGWEFIRDAARWTYDESRHCQMGYERLIHWGFEPNELPLGTFIYESGAGHDPIYLLGMLYFFETLNIGKKIERVKEFGLLGDMTSQSDMDYDWADETLHAHYGKRWLTKLLGSSKKYGEFEDAGIETIRGRCAQLVKATINSSKEEENLKILQVAGALIHKAQDMVAKSLGSKIL